MGLHSETIHRHTVQYSVHGGWVTELSLPSRLQISELDSAILNWTFLSLVDILGSRCPRIHRSPTENSPPFQLSLATLHLPLSPCLFHLVHCCFHFFMSCLLQFHLSPNRARELEATCCSFSVQQLLEDCRPYPQQFLSVMSLPLLY